MSTQSETASAGDRRGSKGVLLGGERSEGSQHSEAPQDGLIGDLKKNRREFVRVQLRTFKGIDLADIRVHFPDDETGELRPTGKGVSIKPVLLPELIALLQSAEQEARQRGLL